MKLSFLINSGLKNKPFSPGKFYKLHKRKIAYMNLTKITFIYL
jgi:hypothetical protein